MKKAIIIGASSGIGRELAKLFAQNNWRVGITGRRKELLDSLQAEFPDHIYTSAFDVTGDDNIPHVQHLIKELGGLDLIIYNSGYGEPSATLDWQIEKQTVQTNVNGFIEIINYAFNYFVERGRGQIAGISSIASVHGNSWAPAYSASKAFMSNYLEGLHMKVARMPGKEGSELDMSITDIQPGFIKTKMAKGNKQFWISPVDKAVKQIFKAIQQKKRKAYITRRWWIIAKLINNLPYWLLKRIM